MQDSESDKLFGELLRFTDYERPLMLLVWWEMGRISLEDLRELLPAVWGKCDYPYHTPYA